MLTVNPLEHRRTSRPSPIYSRMSDTTFQLDGEHETRNGWLYTFSVGPDGQQRDHELTLSWVDHEHLVGGAIAPERVAFAAFGLSLDHFGAQLPTRFDLSMIRRRIDDFDAKVRARIEAPL